MKFKVEWLKIKDFRKFQRFARDIILDQFLDYPSRIRKYYWKKDFNRDDLKRGLKTKKNMILLAKSPEKIIGFAFLNCDRGGGVQVSWLGVDKSFRQKGIGSSLLKEIEKHARQHQCHFIYLWTENKNNIKFYQKRGYYLVGIQRESWFGMDEYLMQKNIGKPFSKQWN